MLLALVSSYRSPVSIHGISVIQWVRYPPSMQLELLSYMVCVLSCGCATPLPADVFVHVTWPAVSRG